LLAVIDIESNPALRQQSAGRVGEALHPRCVTSLEVRDDRFIMCANLARRIAQLIVMTVGVGDVQTWNLSPWRG
jgi:hypothetical protein